jgi:Ca2+/H+ antiporter
MLVGMLARGRTTQLGGSILLVAYAGLVVAFYYSGNR